MMDQNTLYPVFLKLSSLRVLIVGGGFVAEEKLSFLLKSSPDAHVTMVATYFREGTVQIACKGNVSTLTRSFESEDLTGHQIVIAATNNPMLNEQIYQLCRESGILVNVADNPPLCDFYMGGIVTKGNLKIAISTNGQSPTTAKRLREFFEVILPDTVDELLQNLNTYRRKLKGSFQEKVDHLNELTRELIS